MYIYKIYIYIIYIIRGTSQNGLNPQVVAISKVMIMGFWVAARPKMRPLAPIRRTVAAFTDTLVGL